MPVDLFCWQSFQIRITKYPWSDSHISYELWTMANKLFNLFNMFFSWVMFKNYIVYITIVHIGFIFEIALSKIKNGNRYA